MSTLSKHNILDSGRFNIRGVPKVYKEVPIELMRPGLYQTRKYFNKSSIDELAQSLAASGMNFTPLIVRPLKFSEGYELICGERRWRAAQQIGLDRLVCCIASFTDEQAMYISGADNIQREDLNPLEEAQSYDLMIQSGLTQQEVSVELGRSRATVANHLRLLKLPLYVRDCITKGSLNYAQVRPLCSLSAATHQIQIAKNAVERKWNSNTIIREVAKIQAARRVQPRVDEGSDDVDIKRLKTMVEEQTGYACVILRTDKGGWQIGISAPSADAFQGILDRLGVNTEDL